MCVCVCVSVWIELFEKQFSSRSQYIYYLSFFLSILCMYIYI